MICGKGEHRIQHAAHTTEACTVGDSLEGSVDDTDGGGEEGGE